MDRSYYLKLVYTALENLQNSITEAQQVTQAEFNALANNKTAVAPKTNSESKKTEKKD